MRPLIDSQLSRIRLRLRAVRAANLAALSLSIVCAILLISLLLVTLSSIAAVLVGLVLIVASLTCFWRMGIYHFPNEVDAAIYLERAAQLGGRAVSYVELRNNHDDPRLDLIEAQLEPTIERLGDEILPKLNLTTHSKYAAAALPILLFLNGWVLWGLNHTSFTKPEALALADLESDASLPEELRERIGELAKTIEEHALSEKEVTDALARAQAALLSASAEHSDQSKEVLSEGSNSTSSPEQTAVPTATPKPTQTIPPDVTPPPNFTPPTDVTPPASPQDAQKQDGSKGASSDSKDQKDKEAQQGSNQGKDSQKSDQNAEQQKGKSGGGEGDGQQGEKQGKGQSDQSKQGDQSGDSKGSEGKQGKESNDGGGSSDSGKQGDGKQAQGEQANSIEKAKDALSQLEKKVEQAKQDQKGDQDKGDKEGQKNGQGQKDGQQQGAGKSPGGEQPQDQKGEQGAKGDQGEPNQEGRGGKPQDKQSQDQSKQGEKGDSQADKGKNDAAKPEGRDKDGRSNDSKNEASQSSQQNDPNAQAREFEEGQGPPGTGEGKRTKKDTEVAAGDEKFDPNKTGSASERALNRGDVHSKTEIGDVKLAKPEPLKDQAAQPIPLEYQELLR